MVGAALRRSVVGATLAIFGSACAGILGDFELDPDACAAGDLRVCKCESGTGTQRCAPQGVFGSCDCAAVVVCGDGRRDPSECDDLATYCAADCCPDGVAEVDECAAGDRFCPADCVASGSCDPDERCASALVLLDSSALCANTAARGAFFSLKKCLCNGSCQSECQSSLCNGTPPTASSCITCAMTSSACGDEYLRCAME